MAQLLDYDPLNGITTTMVKDGDSMIVKSTQDVEFVLDQNQAARSDQESGWRGDMHRVASIPMIIVNQWWQELGDNPLLPRNRAWLAAKLNNPDFSKLRTKDGRI